MKISVIIPTYNEAPHIVRLVRMLREYAQETVCEIIVTDGGSTDGTGELALEAGAQTVYSPQKGRAAQMNYAASLARGDVFYFVHADVQINAQYPAQIAAAINEGTDLGCYRYRFDSPKKILRFNSYMTRFNTVWAGGGDQTLFIKKACFERLNGFRAGYRIMEDFDLVRRAKKQKMRFTILPHEIRVSARKYEKNSWLRVQLANTLIVLAWRLGASQNWMANTYKKLLRG